MHPSSPHPIRATCPASLILLDLITWIVFGEKYRSWSSTLCYFLQCPVNSSVYDPNIFLSALFSNTLCTNTKQQVKLNIRLRVSLVIIVYMYRSHWLYYDI
jgi:hypothetical protein